MHYLIMLKFGTQAFKSKCQYQFFLFKSDKHSLSKKDWSFVMPTGSITFQVEVCFVYGVTIFWCIKRNLGIRAMKLLSDSQTCVTSVPLSFELCHHAYWVNCLR